MKTSPRRRAAKATVLSGRLRRESFPFSESDHDSLVGCQDLLEPDGRLKIAERRRSFLATPSFPILSASDRG